MRGNPIRNGVVVLAYFNQPKELIATLESIRKQTLIPWFVRVVDMGAWTHDYPEVRKAISDLNEVGFCPNVLTMSFGANRSLESMLNVAFEDLVGKDIDVIVAMDVSVTLKQTALYDLTISFYNPDVQVVAGDNYLVEIQGNWWTRMSYRVSRGVRKDLKAFRKSVIQRSLA